MVESISCHKTKGIHAFLLAEYPFIFYLFHLLRGIAAATKIFSVEKKNRNDSEDWHTQK